MPDNSVQGNVLVSPLSFQYTCILSEVVIWANYERGWHCSAPYSSLVSKNGSICRFQLIIFPCDITFFWLFVQIFLASSRLHSSFHSPVKFSLSYGVHATCDMCTWHIMCNMCILLYVHVQDRHVYDRSISLMTHTYHATCMHVHPSHRWQRRECLAKCTSENYTCMYLSLNFKRHMIFLIRHITYWKSLNDI